MTTIKFREWELIVDKELTKLTYDKVAIGGPERCGCDDCRNFASNREAMYPDEIKKLFIDLAIDYKKESEVFRYYRQEDGLHVYGGWFHFKGQFKGKDCAVPTGPNSFTLEMTPINDLFGIGFSYQIAMTFFENRDNLVQIEFNTKTPWTIEKELERD